MCRPTLMQIFNKPTGLWVHWVAYQNRPTIRMQHRFLIFPQNVYPPASEYDNMSHVYLPGTAFICACRSSYLHSRPMQSMHAVSINTGKLFSGFGLAEPLSGKHTCRSYIISEHAVGL